MTYSVKEIYYTLQGEGAQAGRPAVFCRFAGCNLWTGREKDRPKAICQFCDTDFVGTDGPSGGKFPSAEELATAIMAQWPAGTGGRPLVVFTGGEPGLQLDGALLKRMQAIGFDAAIETNGTIALPEGLDWICVSPKAGTDIVVTRGDELKLIFPQSGADPERYVRLDFRHRYLQPMDGPEIDKNTKAAIAYCLEHPQWHLSLQTHKIVGIE